MQPLSLDRVVCMFSYQLATSILFCLSLSLFFYKVVLVNILNFGGVRVRTRGETPYANPDWDGCYKDNTSPIRSNPSLRV